MPIFSYQEHGNGEELYVPLERYTKSAVTAKKNIMTLIKQIICEYKVLLPIQAFLLEMCDVSLYSYLC